MKRTASCLAALAAGLVAAPALGQAPAADVHLPAEFAAYAPRSALDMVRRLPSFTIRESDGQRGLGQASGNVLLNGARVAGKGESMAAQLDRIPAASVIRIEVVDGAGLDIPGLSGQVANVVYKLETLSGQFAWKPEFRPRYTPMLYTKGSISVSGRSGPLAYELGLANDNGARRASWGPELLRDGAGNLVERRDDVLRNREDRPKLSARLTHEGADGTIAHLNAQREWASEFTREDGLYRATGAAPRRNALRERFGERGWELGGDVEFAAGPGRLKLIAIASAERETFSQAVVVRREDRTLLAGDRYAQTERSRERIARAEYGWAMLGGQWQLSAEGAFNALAKTATTGVAAADGSFTSLPFPDASGRIAEDRYETMLSVTRQLTPALTLQLGAGGEHSTIRQTGPVRVRRAFLRPKGSLTLAWRASPRTDLSLQVERRVGQLSFGDFLARAFIDDGTANAGNSDLRPQQEWALVAEATHKLGRWGSIKARIINRRVEDYVDIIPVGDGESVGNIPRASLLGARLAGTIELAPLGWKGARLDIDALLRRTRLRDPFTLAKRPWGGFETRKISINLRHDIPGSDWAWGGNIEHARETPQFRRRETDRFTLGPEFAELFVEHKNVMGLTLRATVDNVNGGRELRERIIYAGLRGQSPVRLVESRRRKIGPIFRFVVSGSL